MCRPAWHRCSASRLQAADGDRLHLDRLDRAVIFGPHHRDLHHDVERGLVNGLAEDGVLGFARREPVEEVVVHRVHEELRAARVRLARVRHAKGARLVGDLGRVLILDVAAIGALLNGAGDEVLEAAVLRAAGASFAGLRVL